MISNYDNYLRVFYISGGQIWVSFLFMEQLDGILYSVVNLSSLRTSSEEFSHREDLTTAYFQS